MKLVRTAGFGEARYGRLNGAGDELQLLPASIDSIGALIAHVHTGSSVDGEWLPLDSSQLLAPVAATPRNIFCVGKNYRDHAREFSASGFDTSAAPGLSFDSHPAVFTKPGTAIIGPNQRVDLHRDLTSSVDYEAELAVIIGRPGRNIQKTTAMEHVWGYVIVNDVTARDRQRDHKQWFLGKGLDTFCPMGPWIATADELDPTDLDIRAWVNGELRQEASTRDLIFDIPTLISTISAGMTLLPGDVISTGTPAGVGIGFDPPRFLRAGDTVKIAITGLGELSTVFE